MAYKYFPFFILCGALVFSGCGKDRTGTYSGTENINTPGVAAQSASASLNITDDSNSTLTGTLGDSSGSSQFSGQISDDGASLNNVSLNVPAQAAGSSVNGVPTTGCGGVYTGTLTYSDTGISGTLTLTSPQAVQSVPTSSPYYGSSTQTQTATNPCQGATRAVSLTKST